MARSDGNAGAKAPGDQHGQTSQGDDGPRPSGIDLIGGMKWGTHFCQFYETPQDLLEILVPYFREGLAGNEFCMWVTSPPVGVEEARNALRAAVPDLDERIRAGQLEILDYTQWYKVDGRFDEGRVLDGWVGKLEAARARGLEGLRLTGNTFWLEANDWKDFTQYEETVNNVIGKYRMLAICTYSLSKCSAPEIMDVIANHQFAMVKRQGRWELVESSERKKAVEALRSSEARLRGILNATQESIWMFDTDGVVLMANTIAMARLGKGASDIIGRHMRDIISPDLARARMERLREVVDSARPVEFEDERAGMHFHHSFYPVLDPAGAVTSVVSFSRDITERRKAEEEVRALAGAVESEKERLRALIDSIADEVWFADTDGKFVLANASALKEFGLAPGTDVGVLALAGSLEVRRPDGIPRPVEEAPNLRALRGETVRGMEELVRTPASGELRSRLVSSAPVRDHAGKIIGSVSVVKDITERKRAEEVLAEIRSYLESLFDYANAPIIVWSPDFRINRFNHAFEKLSGYDAKEVLGKKLEMLFPEQTKEDSLKKIARTAGGEYWESIEIPIRQKGGTIKIALWNSANIYGRDGKTLISTIAQGQDITGRKNAEEALRESEIRYRTMFEASVNQLVLIRAVRDEKGAIADWRYIEVNEHALKAMGLGREQLLGRTLRQVIPDRAEQMGGRWSKVLATGRPVEYEADFGGRHFMVSVFRMDPETIVSSSVDITERKKAEAALRKALERNSQQEKLAAIGRLAGGVAHEIRNPLAAIKNAVYYLNMALDKPEASVTETLALLNREIARSEDIISSLLGLAHPGRAARSNVDVNELMRECLRQPPGAAVEVITDLDGKLPAVRADPAQLAIVFGNIIRNAFEAMTKGGCLRVSTRAEEGWVSVSISDTGHGITKENMGKIFEPLMTTKDGGTGLGLPVAKTLVEGHGGSIEVESEPGKGSTFTVRLPTKQRSKAGE